MKFSDRFRTINLLYAGPSK